MRERPILFSGPMVRAILSGQKTQTRRVVKITHRTPGLAACLQPSVGEPRPRTAAELCPYGQPGDRLWVREAWQHTNHPLGPYQDGCPVYYRADYLDDPHGPDGERSAEGKYRSWRPSIHMPRTACRLELEILGVRVERLQAINEHDAQAEGADALNFDNCGAFERDLFDMPLMENGTPRRNGFALLWEAINGDGSWASNPWVWVVEFKLVETTANDGDES